MYIYMYNYKKPIKLPLENYSIFENLIYKSIIYINKDGIFRNIHPNIITILRFIIALSSIYLYNRYKTKGFGILLIFAYLLNIFLDYLDGYIARSYDKCTVLGDILDHIFDWTLFFLLYILINNKTRLNNILLFINLILLAGYFGSHQNIYNKSNKINEILDLTKLLVIFDDKFYTYFSDVVFYLHLIILFIYKNLMMK
jgi:phosphatidylglycerophosphate synthase